MNADTILLIILSVGTLVLNKDLIFSEWLSMTNPDNYPDSEEQP